MTNPADYFNTHNKANKYFEIMALAGFVEQSREDNELQSILLEIVKCGLDTLYKNDSIVSGGDLGRGVGANVFKVTAAKFYHGGIVHDVPAATLTLTGTGTETIGVLVTETIITPADDPGLLDPASGADNYGQPGAYRRKIECTWVANNVSAVTMFTFLAGVQQTQPVVGEVDVVASAMATRTYDSAGNFTVTGFDLSLANRDTNTLALTVGNANTTLGFSGSKGYVQGNQIVKLVPETLTIAKALDPRAVTSQSFFFDGSTNLFQFPKRPAFKIDRVVAIFDVIRTVTNHNYQGYDEVIQPGETLVTVLAAYHSGTPASQVTPYTKAASQSGTGDWYQSDSGLRWDVNGTSTDPVTSGDSYQVYCLVSRVLTTGFGITVVSGKTNFDITSMGTKPYHTNLINGSTQLSEITVDYQYYLSRVDTVYMDADGTLGIVKGVPEDNPVAKTAPGGTMALGQVRLDAGGDATTAVITTYPTRRRTTEEIEKVITRLTRAEYNLAVTNLDKAGQARAGNAITSLRGVLTEAFSYSANDIATDGVGGVSKIKFVRAATTSNMIDIENRELQLPQREATWCLVPTAAGHTAAYCPRAILAPYTAGAYMRAQMAATDTRVVNEFGDGVTRGYQTLQLFPNGDTSMETVTATLNTIDPTNAFAIASSYNPDQRTFSQVATAAPNLVGFFDSSSPYLADQWILVKGAGFTPGAVLDVKMDGLTPRGYTIVAGATAFAAISGPPASPAVPAQAFPSGVSACSPAVTFIGGTATANVYPNTANPVVNANGEFDFWIRTPLDASGKPLRTGAKNITVHSSSGDHASQVFQASPFRQLALSAVDGSAQVMQAMVSLLPPTVPSLTSVAVTAATTVTGFTAGATVSNIPTGQGPTLKFRVTWDPTAGGLPSHFLVTLSSGATKAEKYETSPGVINTLVNQAGHYIDITMAAPTTSAVEYNVYAINAGGASIPKTATITYNSLPPNLTPPTLTSFVADNGGSLQGWNASTTVSWAGLGVGATGVIITVTNAYGVTTLTPTVAASATIPLALYAGNNLVRMVASSAAGSVTKELTITVTPPRDPVAQTFSVDKDGFVDGVDVYFSQIPSGGVSTNISNITAEIRNVTAGFPGGPEQCVVNAAKTLARASTAASADATVATYFQFDTPPYLRAGRQYALVVTTDSSDYRLYYAKVGNTQIVPSGQPAGTTLSRQAYLDGVMFTSSNSATWSPMQDADLKFRVRGATFTTGETIVNFDPVVGTNMVGIYMSLDLLLPAGILPDGTPSTRAVFEYQLDGAGAWYAVEPDTYEYFNTVAATQVNLRARLRTDDPLLSPVVLRNANLKIQRIYRDLIGQYITKTATYTQAYQTVRMIAKMALPTGCDVRWFVSDNTAQLTTPANWSSGTAYVVGNVVTYAVDGAVYVAIQNGTNHTPGAGSTYWAPARVDQGVLWRELPASGQTVTLQPDGVFSEYERTIDLGVNGSRFQFRFYLEPVVNSVANSIQTPRVRDVITICNA